MDCATSYATRPLYDPDVLGGDRILAEGSIAVLRDRIADPCDVEVPRLTAGVDAAQSVLLVVPDLVSGTVVDRASGLLPACADEYAHRIAVLRSGVIRCSRHVWPTQGFHHFGVRGLPRRAHLTPWRNVDEFVASAGSVDAGALRRYVGRIVAATQRGSSRS